MGRQDGLIGIGIANMYTPRPRSRAAFTLIEALVVIAIIGVLVAILVPAVQLARESATRASCGNNLKQLGLASQSYHDAFGGFPAAATTSPTLHGWGVHLLPYVEQDNLYQRYNWSKNWYDPANAPVISTPLSVMRLVQLLPRIGPSKGIRWACRGRPRPATTSR